MCFVFDPSQGCLAEETSLYHIINLTREVCSRQECVAAFCRVYLDFPVQGVY